MTEPNRTIQSARRRSAGIAARVIFVAAAVGFAIWGFRDDWPSITEQVAAVPAWSLVFAVGLVAVGVIVSLPLWRMLALAYDISVLPATSARILLVGQLGKYLPGAVWPVAAQTQMLREYGVPVRSSVSIGLLYIGVHFASSLGFGSVLALVAGTPWNLPAWIPIAMGVISFLAITPPALRFIARLISGRSSSPHFSWRGTVLAVVCTGATWMTWSLASILIAASGGISFENGIAIVESVLLGYAAGVVVVVAPAGLGVREAVVIAITAPTLGFPVAAAVAILARLVSVVADIGVAGSTLLLPRVISAIKSRRSAR